MRQITPSKANFVEKIIRDTNGRLVRATFCVYENGGHVKARLVNVVYLEEKSSIQNQTLVLTCPRGCLGQHQEIVIESKIVSPFFPSYLYYVLGSKPRAPAF